MRICIFYKNINKKMNSFYYENLINLNIIMNIIYKRAKKNS